MLPGHHTTEEKGHEQKGHKGDESNREEKKNEHEEPLKEKDKTRTSHHPHRVASKIDYLHENVSPYLFVVLTVLYMFRLDAKAAYVLLFGTFALVLVEASFFARVCYHYGWIRSIYYYFIECWLRGIWIKILLGIDKLRSVWLGKVLLSYSLLHIGYFSILWLYYNVNLFRFMDATITLCRVTMSNMRDPVALTIQFNVWIHSVFVGAILDRGSEYIRYVSERVEAGSGSIVLVIAFISFVLIMITIIVYALAHVPWKRYMRQCGLSRSTLNAISELFAEKSKSPGISVTEIISGTASPKEDDSKTKPDAPPADTLPTFSSSSSSSSSDHHGDKARTQTADKRRATQKSSYVV